ncbi:MAG TPA: hypothetical protein VGV40_06500 [Solirubrobacteraceae bacterium]|nr:hypothetical protein [Solirubrobacteraceae bacterium]
MRAHVSFVAGLLAALVAAPAAHAAPTQETILMDDNRLLYRGAAVTDATLAELRALGVDRVRVSVHWANLAPRARAPAHPNDPAAYDPGVFDAHDHLVRQAARGGLEVLFNITGGAPRWAAGRARGRFVNRAFAPDPRAFHHFARMIGRRYDGTYPDENQGGRTLPRVSAWSVWNEPNHGAFLQPQWTRDAQRRWRPASPARYRRLARAGLSGLAASGHTTPSDILLLGETSPLGNGSRRGRTQTIAPAAFLRELLCLDRRLHPLRGARARRAGCDFARRGELAVNAYAHHPYSIISPPATSRRNRDEVSLADVRRLYRILDAAARAGHLRARLPVWVTEYGWQTPPDPFRGVDPVDGGRWWSQAERQTRADPRVGALTQFLLLDDEPDRARRAGSKPFWRTWQSGLRYANGTPKPVYDAFRLPLVVPTRTPTGRPFTMWGLVRPAPDRERGLPTTVRLQFRPPGSTTWQEAGRVEVSAPSGVFTARPTSPGPGTWRYLWTEPAPAAPSSRLGLLRPRPAPPPPPTHASQALNTR